MAFKDLMLLACAWFGLDFDFKCIWVHVKENLIGVSSMVDVVWDFLGFVVCATWGLLWNWFEISGVGFASTWVRYVVCILVVVVVVVVVVMVEYVGINLCLCKLN